MITSTAEQNIGISTFFTQTKGIEGKLRIFPEDFHVVEQFQKPPLLKNGQFTIAEITAKNWETNMLIRMFAQNLHISRKRISFAGTKDKRALTTQLFSFHNIDTDVLQQVKIKDVDIENVYQSSNPITLGSHKGNHFDINIRTISKTVTNEHIQHFFDEIQSIHGFPNFYGPQRFGVIRPITNVVGKHIVNGDIQQAVMTYLAEPFPAEEEHLFSLRKNLQKTHDFSTALKEFPEYFVFERSMLQRLVEIPEDYINALTVLPKNLLTMFVYAYQSFLFNKIVSERIKKQLPLDTALIGDIVLKKTPKGIINEYIPVSQQNIEKVNKQIHKGRAMLSGVLFGYNVPVCTGEMGEIEQKIIENEQLKNTDFVTTKIPYLSSSGLRRALLCPLQENNWKLQQDTISKNHNMLSVSFDLSKGSYATSFLRELMKSKSISDY